MDYLIAPALFQNNICRLPGIGTLQVITKTAETDFVNTQIKSPVPSIVFSPSLEDENVFNEFTALSELIKKDLSQKGNVTLKGIGNFVKDENGNINFLPQQVNPVFTPPVTARRIVRQDIEHNILVGDKETTTTVMTEYFVEDGEVKKTMELWWILAILLGVIGITILAYYLSQNGIGSFGNVSGF